ncbi:hypothetical protein ACQKMV_07610 [Lysinibacillus sp. NPDC094403]|uniref:hypothetical protein n=1 Tax=Lysinibacillus sp. NPDC094403 TaxID=3390581 RepID=UPI003D0031A0
MKILKVIIFFIIIVISLVISERGIIYYLMSTPKPGPINPYPLSEVLPFVRHGIAAIIVLIALWITNKIMHFFSHKNKINKKSFIA